MLIQHFPLGSVRSYLVFVQGVQIELETLVWSLTRLWANALRLGARPETELDTGFEME